MREPRVYTNQRLQVSTDVLLDAAATAHLQKVLRLRVGAMIRLFNGDGLEYQGQLIAVRREQIQVQLTAIVAALELESVLKLHLMLGISRGERMDFALQKAVELGVTRLSPLLTQRSVVQLKGERMERRHQHWQQLVISACEQSGRCRLPELELPQTLDKALDIAASDLRLVLHHLGVISLDKISQPVRSVTLLIGPEGGLAPEELQFAQQQGFLPLRLGPRILRTETAPLAALAALQALWGDFRAD